MKIKSTSLAPNAAIVLSTDWWWLERLVLGVWMLATLVLTKSYASNLMSLLAIRHVPQPFQTPRDVLNDPHIAMIWQKDSKNEEFLRVSLVTLLLMCAMSLYGRDYVMQTGWAIRNEADVYLLLLPILSSPILSLLTRKCHLLQAT